MTSWRPVRHPVRRPAHPGSYDVMAPGDDVIRHPVRQPVRRPAHPESYDVMAPGGDVIRYPVRRPALGASYDVIATSYRDSVRYCVRRSAAAILRQSLKMAPQGGLARKGVYALRQVPQMGGRGGDMPRHRQSIGPTCPRLTRGPSALFPGRGKGGLGGDSGGLHRKHLG